MLCSRCGFYMCSLRNRKINIVCRGVGGGVRGVGGMFQDSRNRILLPSVWTHQLSISGVVDFKLILYSNVRLSLSHDVRPENKENKTLHTSACPSWPIQSQPLSFRLHLTRRHKISLAQALSGKYCEANNIRKCVEENIVTSVFERLLILLASRYMYIYYSSFLTSSKNIWAQEDYKHETPQHCSKCNTASVKALIHGKQSCLHLRKKQLMWNTIC